MKRNRILAIGIALLLAVQLLTPLACAAGTTLKLTAPDKLPDVGQTFTVTAELTGNTGLAAVQLSLGYDDSVVECTGIENGALVAGMLAASNPYATRGGVGAILAAATTTAVKTDGSLAVFTFRVKAAGDAKLTLADALLSDTDGKALPLSYSLPALIAQGSGSDSGSGSGSDAEKPGTDNKKSEDDKKSEDEDKPEDEEKPAESSQKSATDYGFFRERLFWLTTALCFFYEAVEASMMGWLTTFYIDSGVLAAGAAQIVTSLLWISLLVGRFSCSVIAARFRPWQMITVMCFGIAAFLVLLVLGTSLPVLIVATIGLGLCMSGMYGTTVSNAGDLFSRYPASMGIYVTLNGLGAAAAPAAIGVAANHGGIRIGFALLLIAAAMLVVSALCNMRYLKKR